MTSSYECEVRFMIPDIDKFKKKLKELGAKTEFDYEFTDYYYINDSKKPWDLSKKNIRLRTWKKPKLRHRILFTELELVEINGLKFKRSIFKEGKVCLHEGNLGDCRQLLKSLNFEEWFSIEKKKCTLYKIPKHDFKTIKEFIPDFGWTGELEVEGDDPEKAARKLKEEIEILDLEDSNVKSDPVSLIYVTKNNLLD